MHHFNYGDKLLGKERTHEVRCVIMHAS